MALAKNEEEIRCQDEEAGSASTDQVSLLTPRDSATQTSRRPEDTEPCWVKLDPDETRKESQTEKRQGSWSPV